ncbi:MAG: hypothetical protein KA715_08340 [Xanthomonadaceae bacterium]|nr:hypothetical protein [Xanthomonadaceae bacterium]
MKNLLRVVLLMISTIPAFAQEKTTVSFPGGSQLKSIKVIKDLDPGIDGIELLTDDGGCLVSGQKLVANMDTARWILSTSTEAYTANTGPWDVAVGAILPGFNKDGSDSWFNIHCVNRKHSVQSQQIKDTLAEYLELEFQYIDSNKP